MKTSNRQIMKELVKEIKLQNHNYLRLKRMIKEALLAEFDFNTQYYGGKTLLHYAIAADAKGIISLIVKCGTNPNLCDDHFNTPLHLAVSGDHYQLTKELLKQEVDINSPGEFEQTPLHQAVITGNLDMVILLVKNGADINLVDEKNNNALDYAKDEKNEKIYNYLKSEKDHQKEK